MWVYGDIEREEDAAAVATQISARLERCRTIGPRRHDELVAAFIQASELVQGVADAELARRGFDEVSAAQDAGAALLLDLAQSIALSWDDGVAEIPFGEEHLTLLSAAGAIRTKQAEGHAFYALYPESYLMAARRSGLDADTCVIGVRSIGIGLGAMVAAGLGAAKAVSIRPAGQPFDRRMVVGDGLAARLLAGTADYAIVDEGPGLSGSSFNCVADWLVAHDVAEERIHFFASHNGALGNEAQSAHVKRWVGASKHVAGFDGVLLKTHRLEGCIAGVVGPLVEPMIDLSGGGWRSLEAGLPPADPAMEKRKFLVETAEGRWLAKFVGLGSIGEGKLKLARELAGFGFLPAPSGLFHGFMITPWVDRTPTPEHTPPRERVLDYLAFRASVIPTNKGARLSELFAMAAYNLGQFLGPDAADAATMALGDAARFGPQPCCTDNRMHAWEWVHGPQGWMKFDALDHHGAHDLVGCQDIAWDLAGAAVELDMPVAELGPALYRRLERPFNPDFIAAMTLSYLGFQIGLWTMASERNGAAETPGHKRQLARYNDHLEAVLPRMAEISSR